jgi:pyruvate/2-oxoglutarate dehydrogenase complex dihydrolipoamide acyltransferase (E2) component
MPNVPGQFVKRTSSWRTVAPLVWGGPSDPSIYGIIDADVSKALIFLERRRLETGIKLTLTHLVTRAIALALRRHPECNAYVRWGRIYQRRDVDIFVLVARPPECSEGGHDQRADLSGVRLPNADTLSIEEIAIELQRQVARFRTGEDRVIGPLKDALRAFPSSLARWGLQLVTLLQYEFNLDLSRFGVPRDTFGGAIVSSMGMFGIRYGFAPLVPAMRLSCLLGVGRVEERAVVVDGNIVIRPILPITATLDHRIIDGYQAGRLAATLTALLSDPEGNGL